MASRETCVSSCKPALAIPRISHLYSWTANSQTKRSAQIISWKTSPAAETFSYSTTLKIAFYLGKHIIISLSKFSQYKKRARKRAKAARSFCGSESGSKTSLLGTTSTRISSSHSLVTGETNWWAMSGIATCLKLIEKAKMIFLLTEISISWAWIST